MARTKTTVSPGRGVRWCFLDTSFGRTEMPRAVGPESFEIRIADGVVYDVEEWAAPSKLIRAHEGDKLVSAVDGKNLLVKMTDGIRKLKIVAKYEDGR